MSAYSRGSSHTGSLELLQRIVVDDTGAILAGLPLSLPAQHYTTPQVVEEVRDRDSKAVLETALESGRLEVLEPPNQALSEARRVAVRAGVSGRLSPTDLSVLALALHLTRECGCEVLVATDDYALQLAAKRSGLGVVRIRYPGVRET